MSLGLGLGLDKNRVISSAFFQGVFDQYANGLFGISSRLLRADYAGNDITVRRSNDNATDDIGVVDNLIDSSSLSTFIGANSGLVTDAYDQTANTNDASQSTAANQPTIINSGTLQTINSIAAYDFDGTDDSLLVWNNTTAPSEFQNIGADLTVILRVNSDNVSGGGTAWAPENTICEIRQNNGVDAKVPFSIGFANNKFFAGITDDYINNPETFESTATVTTSTDYYLAVTITGTTLKLFINGALDSTHTISSATGARNVGTSNSTFSIGVRSRDGGQADNRHYTGKLNELLLFNSALSDSNVISIMDNSTL